jgi:hypothetical protein
MGLGAMAENPNLKVRIQPVGLSYFHAHKFRSRAVVEFGAPLEIPQELVELFKQGGDKKREASGKLLDMIYEALKTVTFRAPDYDTLMVWISTLATTAPSHILIGDSSGKAAVQSAWRTSESQPSCRAEQAVHRRLLAF